MPRRWAAFALAVCLAFGLAVVPPATTQDGTVVGRPNFDLVVSDNRVAPGETTTLSAVLVNDARVFRGGDPRDEERVTTAYNVSVRPQTEQFGNRLAEGLSFETGRVPVGVVPPGVTGPIPFEVAVGRLPPGEYRVPFEVNFSYTASVQPNQTVTLRTRTETLNARIVVESDPRLRLVAASEQSLSPGESEVVRFAVTNVGTEPASEVGVTLSTDNGSVYFGTRLDRRAKAGFYVPSLAPGETETLEVPTGADDATEPGSYLVTGQATYRDESGRVRESDWLATGIDVRVGGQNQSSFSPAPSRTITAIPVSKSAIASAESSARPTPSRVPSSWTIATSSPGRTSGPAAATNLAKTFLPSRTNGSLSSPTTTRPAGGSSAAATRRPPSSPSVNRPSVP